MAVTVTAAALMAVGWLATRTVGAVHGVASASNYIDGEDAPGDAKAGVTSYLISAIVADLDVFWAGELPAVTGSPFTRLRGSVLAVDSSAESGSAPCVATPSTIVGNAYYCPSDDGIVYDATTLVPVVLHRSGIGGLITTFAHEFGHAVQARVATADPAAIAPLPLVTEARADCDAGAFLAWAVTGHAPRLTVDGDILMSAIRPLIDFSDPATVRPDDPTAHGMAVDRLTWFLAGYRGGAQACIDLGVPTAEEFEHSAAAPGASPRFVSRSQLLAAAERSVATFAGAPSDASVSPDLLDAAQSRGQFTQAGLVVLAVAASRGDDGVAAACFAGDWVRSVYGVAPTGELGSWPGDADEGLAAVLLQPHVTFEAVAAYITGFRSGC